MITLSDKSSGACGSTDSNLPSNASGYGPFSRSCLEAAGVR